jgi:hypothetical protein
VAIYVYNTDLGSAQAVQAFLNANSYPTTYVQMGSASGVNYAQYSYILIGYDTFSLPEPWSGSSTLPDQIFNSGKPILGLGFGGAEFFDAEGLTGIGYEESAIDNIANGVLNAYDSTNPIWSSPNAVPATLPVTVFSVSLAAVEPYYSPAAGVTYLGQDPLETTYAILTSQTSGSHNYLLWGYQGPVNFSNMTANGQNLFLNAMHYVY